MHTQAALAEAKASLDETLRILNEAKTRLREVEEGIETLKARYEECLAKKEELKEKCDLCSARLSRAEKVCVPLFYPLFPGFHAQLLSLYSTQKRGKAWKDLSCDACHC